MDSNMMIIWTKYEKNPLSSLAPEPGTWRTDASMTVDVLQRGDQYQIFYVGKKDGVDSIGVASCSRNGFDGTLWKDYSDNPVISPGSSGSYDSTHVVDPAAVEWEGKVYLYYSAIGDGPDSIGLAISEDGLNFKKQEKSVIVGRAPEIVKSGDTLYLFYSKDNPKGGYEFHLATSKDGLEFTEKGVIFSPSTEGWDSLSVVTPRIYFDEGIYILIYAGDNEEKDYPKNFGIAFSKDLLSWTRYPGNPILSSGSQGSWDSRAIWFPEILKVNENYYLWYEGYDGKCSQVGLAISSSPLGKIGRSILELK